MPPSIGDEIAELGWCAGAVIAHEMTPHLAHHFSRHGAPAVQVGGNDWLVVVSQTCDVVAKTLKAEPFVEVLHCRPIPKLRSGYKELRSTRILDFKPNRDTHEQVVLSAHAVADRYLIPRELLKGYAPDTGRRLSQISTISVLSWYALRYSRPAWPDAFVIRLGNAEDALEAALEPLKDDIAEVRIDIDEKEKELNDSEVYHVAVFFVVDEAVWEGDVDGRGAIYTVFAKFVSELAGCEGIEVNMDLSGVFSGADFSWQLTRITDKWNFANLTHRE